MGLRLIMCHSVILWVINLFLEFIIRTNLRFVEDILIITNNCHCKNNFSLLLKEYLLNYLHLGPRENVKM